MSSFEQRRALLENAISDDPAALAMNRCYASRYCLASDVDDMALLLLLAGFIGFCPGNAITGKRLNKRKSR